MLSYYINKPPSTETTLKPFLGRKPVTMDPSGAYEVFLKQYQILEDLIRSTATKEELSAFFALENKRWPTRKDTWRDNKAELVPRQHRQESVDNCWAIGIFRQWYSLSVQMGLPTSDLSVKKLTLGISYLHKSEEHGLANWDAVISYMVGNGFVNDMRIHYKPKGHAEEETYETYLLHLRSRGPIAVSFCAFPSYNVNPGFRILCPTPVEIARSAFEYNYSKHVALLMGRGVDVEGNEYWELFESSGRKWGDSGFVRLAMHQGLIDFAVEMEM
ncbi:hypothetical protein IGI04_036242 [Brassica rapa subsp. trilocularis]|uniref:Peptidase C1A papain C-terminal domain-containing protein n=1 Tax=Brassica rapa subsp. trilocularis TaxID=1813537 RepID=A0ABQ7LDX6_BRACM|nr:hypothetical protein IGI04_036242 [Brassica rapa subsp. trilocularis]